MSERMSERTFPERQSKLAECQSANGCQRIKLTVSECKWLSEWMSAYASEQIGKIVREHLCGMETDYCV